MCGIAGLFSLNRQFGKSELEKMINSMAHRGPDGQQTWSNADRSVQFAHRRLAVIDLSPDAAQPMHFNERFTIVHNGEIYNYLELREQLLNKRYHFKTQSDTEVILAAFDCWGQDCVKHFEGMFSFAIWDEEEKTLFAARDRFGQKPFYYFLDDAKKNFGFASEIKAFSSLGLLSEINERQLLLFLSEGFTNDPIELINTFYKSIFQLPPAHYLKLTPHESEMIFIKCWWDLDKEQQSTIQQNEAIEKFATLLQRSVKNCFRADIPIGTCLSGGLDSSSIVAVASKMHENSNSYKVFSAVFPGFEKDESRFSELVAKKFGLQRFTTSMMDLPNELDRFLYQQDEPVNSASAYAQYKVFELAAKEGIRVLLDGQGADEILAGYSKYIHWFLQEMVFKDRKIYQREKSALRANGITFNWGWKNYAAALFPAQAAVQLEKRTMRKIRSRSSINKEFIRSNEEHQLIFKPFVAKLNDILYFNACQGGLQELLRYADRNSMAHGCEVRLPFLDGELVEFIFSLPSTFKICDGYTKWILRKSVENLLPEEITWRKDKIGFEPPQEEWMRTPKLQEMISSSKEELVKRNILEKIVLTKKIQPHGAHAAEGFDWRYLSAAQWLQRK
jgi:asparagine synthase (glutamine-hydrolysing)